MDIPSFYDYLTRARRDLWAVLGAAPDEVLSKDVIPGRRFHSQECRQSTKRRAEGAVLGS